MLKNLSGQTRKAGPPPAIGTLLDILEMVCFLDMSSAWTLKVKRSTFRSQLLTVSRHADATSAKSVVRVPEDASVTHRGRKMKIWSEIKMGA